MLSDLLAVGQSLCSGVAFRRMVKNSFIFKNEIQSNPNHFLFIFDPIELLDKCIWLLYTRSNTTTNTRYKRGTHTHNTRYQRSNLSFSVTVSKHAPLAVCTSACFLDP